MSKQTDAILDLEKLVPTQKTCSALAEAGFPQCVTWTYVDRGSGFDLRLRESLRGQTFDASDRLLPAPTAAELGEMLPDRIALEYHDGRVHPFWLQTEAEGHPKWGAFYVTKESQDVHAPFFRHCDLQTGAKTEAEARAQLWLRLESEGLLFEDDTTK